jgi:hypothetical protein
MFNAQYHQKCIQGEFNRDVVDGRSQGPPPTRQEDALPADLEFVEDSKLKSFSL